MRHRTRPRRTLQHLLQCLLPLLRLEPAWARLALVSDLAVLAHDIHPHWSLRLMNADANMSTVSTLSIDR